MSPAEPPTGSAATISEYRRREESTTLSALPGPLNGGGEESTRELMTLNFGPHHPATHGVMRLLVTLEGEVVRDIKPIVGYVHTGIEKTAEDKAYWKVIPVVERMDYLSYYFNAMAYCGAVEALAEVEVPRRAQYLRVIHLELNRIASHLIWLGTSALDLGAVSIFLYCLRERELILDLFEMSSGARMHTRYFQVGGVIEDIPAEFEAKLREFLKVMPARADEYGALGHDLEELAQLVGEAGGDVLDHAADLEVARVHALAGGHLEQVEDLLALAQAVQEDRDRAEVQRAGAEPDQV